jgi:hypothetical protein
MAIGTTSNGPVGSGIDCIISQDSKQLGYSTDMNINEDFKVEGIQTLGYYGYRNFMSMGYNCDFDLGTFLLRATTPKIGPAIVMEGNALSTPGWLSEADGGGCNINSNGLYIFEGTDVASLQVLFTLIGCQYTGGSLKVAQGELMTRSTKWKARYMLPGLQV